MKIKESLFKSKKYEAMFMKIIESLFKSKNVSILNVHLF